MGRHAKAACNAEEAVQRWISTSMSQGMGFRASCAIERYCKAELQHQLKFSRMFRSMWESGRCWPMALVKMVDLLAELPWTSSFKRARLVKLLCDPKLCWCRFKLPNCFVLIVSIYGFFSGMKHMHWWWWNCWAECSSDHRRPCCHQGSSDCKEKMRHLSQHQSRLWRACQQQRLRRTGSSWWIRERINIHQLWTMMNYGYLWIFMVICS